MDAKKLTSLLLFGIALNMPTAFAQSRKVELPANYDDGISGKFEIRADVGGQVGSDKAYLLEAGVGYNVNSNFYIGFVSGAYPYFGAYEGVESSTFIPYLGELAYRINLPSEQWSPFVQLRGGYAAPVQKLVTLRVGEPFYERQGYVMFELAPGVNYRLRRNIDLRLSLGYALAVPGDDKCEPRMNYTEHMLQGRVGLSFRGKASSPSRAELQAEADRIAQEEQQRELRQYLEEKKAQDEEARRKAREDREARRRLRESENETIQEAAAEESPVEFYCHVTPKMLQAGAIEDQLSKLADIAADNTLSAIIILGYSQAKSTAEATDVMEAIKHTDQVRQLLSRRYGVSNKLLISVFSGFEKSSSPETRPDDAVATIMIQRK